MKHGCDYWRLKALESWAKVVKARDGRCILTGSTEALDAHHLIPKSRHGKYDLDPRNGVTLTRIIHSRAEDDPLWFLQQLKRARPDLFLWYQEHKDDKTRPNIDYEAACKELRRVHKNIVGPTSGKKTGFYQTDPFT